jgi:hypothetical protein
VQSQRTNHLRHAHSVRQGRRTSACANGSKGLSFDCHGGPEPALWPAGWCTEPVAVIGRLDELTLRHTLAPGRYSHQCKFKRFLTASTFRHHSQLCLPLEHLTLRYVPRPSRRDSGSRSYPGQTTPANEIYRSLFTMPSTISSPRTYKSAAVPTSTPGERLTTWI